MKIHTDNLLYANLVNDVPVGVYLDAVQRGSKKRCRAFEVHMVADEGTDAHGIKRAYSTNSGKWGADGFKRAATWVEWGDWITGLFKIDPDAIVGPYEGWEDFLYQTGKIAPHRPERENAAGHQERWADALYAQTALV